jgi:hypothetical protein
LGAGLWPYYYWGAWGYPNYGGYYPDYGGYYSDYGSSYPYDYYGGDGGYSSAPSNYNGGYSPD